MRKPASRSTVVVAVLLVIAGIGWIASLGRDSSDEPAQPDPAVAESIEATLAAEPGVQAADVAMTIECIDRCKGQRYEYRSDVDLTPEATADQVRTIIAAHTSAVAHKLSGQWLTVARGISFTAPGGATLTVGDENGPDDQQVQAFLDAAPQLTTLSAAYGPPSSGQPAEYSLEAEAAATTCAELDTIVPAELAVLSGATAAAGIAAAELTVSCEGLRASIAVTPVSTGGPGWTGLAAIVSQLGAQYVTGFDGIAQDLFISARDGSTVVAIEVNEGQTLPPAAEELLQAILTQLASVGAAGPTLDIKQF